MESVRIYVPRDTQLQNKLKSDEIKNWLKVVGARFDAKPKYDSFIAECKRLAAHTNELKRESVLSRALNNLQYDAVMQNFFHKNGANCCVRLLIRKMQQ